jgi:hypothetical protein
MAMRYEIDKKKRVVICTFSGVITPQDVLAFRQHILLDHDFSPAFSQLSDCTEATKIDISPIEASILAAMSPFNVDSRRAILLPENLDDLGLYEIFKATRRFNGDKGIRRFHYLQEAQDWISPRKHHLSLSKGKGADKYSVRKLAA